MHFEYAFSKAIQLATQSITLGVQAFQLAHVHIILESRLMSTSKMCDALVRKYMAADTVKQLIHATAAVTSPG